MSDCNHEFIPVVYGYPSGYMIQDEIDGKILLGGCVITEYSPIKICKLCNYNVIYGAESEAEK